MISILLYTGSFFILNLAVGYNRPPKYEINTFSKDWWVVYALLLIGVTLSIIGALIDTGYQF